MVKVFSDHGDISEARANADVAQDGVPTFVGRIESNDVAALAGALGAGLNALRYEIRAAAQTISSAIGAAIEEWRGETRGER